MQRISHTPVYNIKAVLKETGLSADVLRAWERRYGLPHPQRTQGRQRLYSQHDIALIKWLKARHAEGMSISLAVERWKESINAGHDPLDENSPTASAAEGALAGKTEAQMNQFLDQWVEACLAFDEAAANQVVNQAFSLYPIETVCTEIIQRGLSLIGERWYQQQASVQQEHFASALATRRLEALIAATPFPTRPHMVMVCCPPGEMHAFPALLLALLLRRKGLHVVYLGADVPLELLTDSVAAIHPDLVVMAAQQLRAAAALRQAAIKLRTGGIQTAYGGWIFNQAPRLREQIPAHFLGDTISEAIEQIDSLFIQPVPVPEMNPERNLLEAAANAFRQQRVLVDAEVFTSMKDHLIDADQLRIANQYLGADLLSALELGDLAYLNPDFAWASMWLTSKNLYPAQFTAYLQTYQQAVRKVLSGQGKVIDDWITGYLKRN